MLRQAGDAIDDLLGLLRAERDFRIECRQRIGADHGDALATRGIHFLHGLGGIRHRDGIVRRRDGHVERMRAGVRLRVGHRHVDGRARGGLAKLHVSRDEGELVEPRGRCGAGAGEAETTRDRRASVGRHEAALAGVPHRGGHRHPVARRSVNGPAVERAAIGAGGVERAGFGNREALARCRDRRIGGGRCHGERSRFDTRPRRHRAVSVGCRRRQRTRRRGRGGRRVARLFGGGTLELACRMCRIGGIGVVRRFHHRGAVVHLSRLQRITVGTRTEGVRRLVP